MKDSMGKRLLGLRKAVGLTQVEVAVATGLGRPYLSVLEKDKKEGSVASICALADFYDVSMDYLLCRSPSPARATNYVAKDGDERALLDAWRDITDEDRSALRIALKNARIASQRDAA